MLRRPPPFRAVPLRDTRDSEVLSAEAEGRGEVKAGTGADTLLNRYNRVHHVQLARNLAGQALPVPGEVLFLLSQKDLNAYTLVLWLLEHGGYCDDLFVTTFNLNADIIRAFASLLDDGRVGTLSIVLSQSIESRMPERVEELRALWETRRERMRVSLCWNHSKVALARFGERAYVVTGSGNYSFNAEIEQYEVWADAALHGWLRETLERRCFAEARMNKRHKIWGVDI